MHKLQIVKRTQIHLMYSAPISRRSQSHPEWVNRHRYFNVVFRPLFHLRGHASRPVRISSSPSKKTSRALGTLAIITSSILFTAYYLDSRSAIHRYIVPPLLRACKDAETAHLIAVKTLALGIAPKDMVDDDWRLRAELWGTKLTNPIGLAAGFDKHAEAMDGMPVDTVCTVCR